LFGPIRLSFVIVIPDLQCPYYGIREAEFQEDVKKSEFGRCGWGRLRLLIWFFRHDDLPRPAENAAAGFESFCLAGGVTTPRANWLKTGNAGLPISIDSGTSPTTARKVIYIRVSSKE
jgi:hypothetical protein